jgi:phage repressor protein C with HTH and peptisase S24 domain
MRSERGVSEFEPTLRDLLAAGHTARFRASGDSMYPAIRSGDYLEIAPCDVSQLRLGDVILATTERGLTAHRIVRIRGARITMRGDNALRSDPSLGPEDVLGRVENVRTESATIMRLAGVLVRRVRSAFQQ